jgi:deoxycytidine triphosphate deaminase
MMLGEKELIKLFPNFKDLVQPSGIDLELDRIYTQKSAGSLIDNEKNLPELKEMEGDIYTLKPHTAYLASIKRKVKIPKGYTMLYLPRSTLLRSFISVQTAVGDPGFYGTLMFMIYNHGDFEYKIKSGDRIAQAVVFSVEGSGEYDGSYQEKEE